jgi:hypothetical protein
MIGNRWGAGLLNDRFFHNGIDGSNPSPSSGESGANSIQVI